MSYNILIGCDTIYYRDWGISLLASIQHYCPWINLHCHIVNPEEIDELPGVDYTYENIIFPNNPPF